MRSSPHHERGVIRGAALRDAKAALRREVIAQRDALSAELRASASEAIATRIAALQEYAAASSVLLTLAFRGEWDTQPLVRTALAAGKKVIVPRVELRARMLELHQLIDPARDIIVGYQGIPEPRIDCPRVAYDAVDFVLIPGVAFDPWGRRLGYGGGYYDRLLPLISPQASRIAGIFELQLVDYVPSAPHDIAVDVIVTESRSLTALR